MDFSTRLKKLNAAQAEAVHTIDGPVMVIAGPGTGKTELLSMRAANILAKTDTLPQNILCLTFTDSGADAMRKRLASIIGNDANKVAIHTFHSFGSEVINLYKEYFYSSAAFRPADEISTYELVRGIFDELEYNNPIAGKMNGEYTHLSDAIAVISELKRSGLTSDELIAVLDDNDATLDAAEPLLRDVFTGRVGASTLAQLIPVARSVAELPLVQLPGGVTPLANVLSLSLAHAIDEASSTDSTKPVTAWKNKWLEKDQQGNIVFKARKRQQKLRAVNYVYRRYLDAMEAAGLYDFDDMILQLVHAMEVHDDLRFNLQEQFQYIMVDEFQDTNLAQMRILRNLTNNPAQEDTPNILVVGDDDQAIYAFQGASISNVQTFDREYPRTKQITLTDNYRSTATVLEHARSIITQGIDRLEYHIPELSKELTAHAQMGDTTVELHEAPTRGDERSWIAQHIRAQIDAGVQPSEITVLARRHRELVELLPYFATQRISVTYEKRNNVLDLEPIQLVESLARVILAIHNRELATADSLLPELLAHPAWNIPPRDLWKLSVVAYDAHARWLDTMEHHEPFTEIHAWLVARAADAAQLPLEEMIDILVGKPQETDEPDVFRSPLYAYLFSDDMRAQNPSQYVEYLEALRTIRTKLREYRPEGTPTLQSFIDFIELYRRLEKEIPSIHTPAHDQPHAINLMTAHKSKGLEFDTVYIFGAQETMWGERVRERSRNISYPENLTLANAGGSSDERIRLFYVAATRAKRQLFITASAQNDTGKPTEHAGFLRPEPFTSHEITEATQSDAVQEAENHWYTNLVTPTATLKEILQPTLDRYRLSATHVNTFLDVTRGGPQTFLLNNLLRFPQAMSASARFGTAIHDTLQRTHAHLTATKSPRAIEDILSDFERTLAEHHLPEAEHEQWSARGAHALQVFLSQQYSSFSPTQKAELSFANQQSVVGEARLNGKIDLADIDTESRTMVVTDYKTGHPTMSWTGKTEFEKIKLHKYKQQLMFYKLMVEHSRDFGTYTVEHGVLQFVEPDTHGTIHALDLSFTREELDTFTQLLQAVWKRITTLNLPDVSGYPQTLKGMQAFEQELIDNNI